MTAETDGLRAEIHRLRVEADQLRKGHPAKVWIYLDNREEVADLVVFDSRETADQWLSEHDPEGAAQAHEVLSSADGKIPTGRIQRE